MTDGIKPEHIMNSKGIDKFHTISELFILITFYLYKYNLEKIKASLI